MAREFGQFDSASWRGNDDWRALTADAQWLYMLLLSQTDLSAAGVLNLAVTRWQHMCADMTPDRFTEALALLEARRFIFTDLAMEELLVRTFARRTQWENSKRAAALTSAVGAMHSPRLRRALAVSLSQVGRSVDGLPAVTPQMLAEFSPEGTPERLAEPWPEPPPEGSASRSRAHAHQTPDAIHQTSTDDRPSTGPGTVDLVAPPAAATVTPMRRGTRIPDDFTVTADMRTWARERGWSDQAIDDVTDEFADYWRALPGTRATKLDWVATWKNRLRDQERHRRPLHAVSGATQSRNAQILAAARDRARLAEGDPRDA